MDERYPTPAADRAQADHVAWEQPAYGVPGAGGAVHVVRVVTKLAAEHGSADLGNRQDPIEELVWIPLTRQTHRQNVMRSWQRIVDLGGPDALLETPEPELATLIKDAGLSRQKARWIKRSLEMIVERFGRLSLDDTTGWSDEELQGFRPRFPASPSSRPSAS